MSEHRHDIQVRWSDIDGLGHVNHATVLTYLEVGRDATLTELGISPDEYVVRRCEVDYVGEVAPTSSTVEYRCLSMTPGHTSVRTRETLHDGDGTVAVTAQFVLVMWDAAARASRSLTDHERAVMSDVGDAEASTPS